MCKKVDPRTRDSAAVTGRLPVSIRGSVTTVFAPNQEDRCLLCGCMAEEEMEKNLDDVELGESGVTMSSSTAQEDLHDGTALGRANGIGMMDAALGRSNGTHDEKCMTEVDILAQDTDGTGSAAQQARLALPTVARDSDLSAYMSGKMDAIREYLREDIDEYLKLGPAGYLQASRDEGADTGVRFSFIKLLSVGWKYEFGELDKV